MRKSVRHPLDDGLQMPPDYAVVGPQDDRSALLLWQRSATLAGMKE